MEKRTLGKTDMNVTRLGLGLAEIPRHDDSQSDVEAAGRVLNAALDGGINFLDTAACYGETEEMMGKTVAHRRDEYFLATKCGHVTGVATGKPWSVETIEQSIDRSLKRLQTDHVDLVQLHSCPLEVLEQGDVIEALQRARDAGKTRYIGHSGDNKAARWAVESGHFDTLQTSYNLVEQHGHTKKLLSLAHEKGMGTIIKRPVANGVWGKATSPYAYGDEYHRRSEIMRELGPLDGEPEDPYILTMGFTLAHPNVDVAIVGSHNPAHVQSNIEIVENQLPIEGSVVQELYRRFEQLEDNWSQLT